MCRWYLSFVLSVGAAFFVDTSIIKPELAHGKYWMYYILAPHYFHLKRQRERGMFSLEETLKECYVLTEHPINRCNFFRLIISYAATHPSETQSQGGELPQYIIQRPPGPVMLSNYGNKRRGYYNHGRYHVTSNPLPLSNPIQSILGLCGVVDILMFHRANTPRYYKVRISVPKPLSVNVSVLHYSSYYEAFGCTYDRVTIGYFPPNSSNFLTCFHFCGRSPKRNVLLPVSTADVHLHYQSFSQDSDLRLQFQAAQPPTNEEQGLSGTNPSLFTAQDQQMAEFAPMCEEINMPKAQNAFSIQTGRIPFQDTNAAYDVAYFLISPSQSITFLPELQFYKVSVYFPVQDCNGQEHDRIIVYDGPYTGVLTPHGLLSPYSVLLQGECGDITNRTACSSVGDISVVWLSKLRKDYQVRVAFSTKLIDCEQEFCFAHAVRPHPSYTKSITVANKEGPSVQVLTFHVRNPNENIHLKFQLHESAFSDVGEYCEYGIIKIVEIQFVRAFYCSKDALKMLNQSENSGGMQFNNRNITIVLKTYPQSARLNMTITYKATYTYGLFNINPVAESHQWFSPDGLRQGMTCFHAMKLTESPFDGKVLHVIPSNDLSCGMQVIEVYSDYNHEFPMPKQISAIIQYPPYQEANVEIITIHVHSEHPGPHPTPDCPFEPWFDYAGNIIDFWDNYETPHAFTTSRMDLTFYRGCLYTQRSVFVNIDSRPAACFDTIAAKAKGLYFEAAGLCGMLTMHKTAGTVVLNSVQIVHQRVGERCCIGIAHIRAKQLPSADPSHEPTVTFKVCPNGGEFCSSNLQYRLTSELIHVIDMAQITGHHVYEVSFDSTIPYMIVFEYEIRLQQYNRNSRVKGDGASTTCYGRTCYTLWRVRRPLSWTDANDTCVDANMALLSINTGSEWQKVLQYFWREDLLFSFIHLGFKEPMVSVLMFLYNALFFS